MPLISEQAWRTWAWTTGDDLYTASWDIDIPPSAVFLKTFLGHYFEMNDSGAADIGIMNIRYRDEWGVDQPVTYPDIDAFDHVATVYNNTLTHATYGMKVKAASASTLVTLGYWG